ncbi:hypothetical protein OROMI_027999 [Orobanche minor]
MSVLPSFEMFELSPLVDLSPPVDSYDSIDLMWSDVADPYDSVDSIDEDVLEIEDSIGEVPGIQDSANDLLQT